MKNLIFIPVLFCCLIAKAQRIEHINLTCKGLICTFKTDMRPVVDSAFAIASAILSSPEFQAEISALTFKCESYCPGCDGIDHVNGGLSGSAVLQKLFQEKDVALTMDLRKSGRALGETSPGSYYTTAWYENIMDDMPELNSFAYGLAVNICHEYMHQVGFCHLYCTGPWPGCSGKNKLREPKNGPDPIFYKDDVTYRVGWSAYYLLRTWLNEGEVIIK